MTDTTAAPASSTPAAPAQRPVPAAGGGGLRLALFALIIVIPVGLLAWVFVDASRSNGVKTLVDGTAWVDLQAMSLFTFDQKDGTIDDVPEAYRALNGQRVALDGEMVVDNTAADQVSDFDLVYSISDCCYGGAPQIQHFVQTKTPPGEDARFYKGRVRAVGTLRVEVTRDDSGVTGVYHLDDAVVEPLS